MKDSEREAAVTLDVVDGDARQHNLYWPPAAVTAVLPHVTIWPPLADIENPEFPDIGKRCNKVVMPHVSSTSTLSPGCK
jgi:hypothetical protein